MSNQIDILEELSSNFLVSSLDTNMARAFPDVRDGLKPGQRACLWEMYHKKYLSSKPHVKSAKISGGVIATWWPHSDVTIYETFTRMSQPFIENVPEIDFHGANGNIILGGDAAANQRYTEARLAGVVEDGMFYGINKNNVDMTLNFSEEEEWPKVLPAVFPRLLVNGAQGIGVSISNTWIGHNFNETAELIDKYIKTGELDTNSYYPDFPTGGTIINKDELGVINRTGKGKVIVEANYRINKQEIDFYEMPYQVYIEPVIEQIKEAVEAEKIQGIKEVLNKSDKKKISLTIVCERGYEPEKVVESLFNVTDLRKQYNANQNGIVSKTPILLTLQQTIDAYISHNIDCIVREHEYDLEKALKRIHILEGLILAVENIDDVIDIIRYDGAVPMTLCMRFKLDPEQVKAILDMKLAKLSRLETDKLVQEKKEKEEIAARCEFVIANEDEQKNILCERLSSLAKKYPSPRKTKVIQKKIVKTTAKKSGKTEFVPETVVVEVTDNGYLKVIPMKSYRTSKNKIFSMKTQNDDYLKLFSNKGKMFRIPLKTAKMCGSGDKGTALGSILQMDMGEKILFADLEAASKICDYVLFVTKNGLVKKTDTQEYSGTTGNLRGLKAMNLKDNDEIVFIDCGTEDDNITIATETHQIYFSSNDVSYQGKAASGVKGINTESHVSYVSLGVNKNLTLQKRGGKGSKI